MPTSRQLRRNTLSSGYTQHYLRAIRGTILSIRAEFEVINIIIAIILNIIFVYIVLKSSSRIARVMGSQGLSVIRKVFGVILLAIAVKLFATNVNGLF